MANTNVTLPTKAQIEELLEENNTTSEWTTLNNVNGRWFTSKKNSCKVFLPAAGLRLDDELSGAGSLGYYWSSSPYESNTNYAYGLSFSSGNASYFCTERNIELSVRPVRQN